MKRERERGRSASTICRQASAESLTALIASPDMALRGALLNYTKPMNEESALCCTHLFDDEGKADAREEVEAACESLLHVQHREETRQIVRGHDLLLLHDAAVL